jgi:phosphoenolpyruvate carboxylase
MPPILQKMASFDAQMRLLVPRKVSEDDKLIEYDALLLDRFLDILQDVNGPEIKETVSVLTFTDQICSGNILV